MRKTSGPFRFGAFSCGLACQNFSRPVFVFSCFTARLLTIICGRVSEHAHAFDKRLLTNNATSCRPPYSGAFLLYACNENGICQCAEVATVSAIRAIFGATYAREQCSDSAILHDSSDTRLYRLIYGHSCTLNALDCLICSIALSVTFVTFRYSRVVVNCAKSSGSTTLAECVLVCRCCNRNVHRV